MESHDAAVEALSSFGYGRLFTQGNAERLVILRPIRTSVLLDTIPFPLDGASIMRLRANASSRDGKTRKPGDWICPNPACKELVFALSSVCRKFQTPKPTNRSV